MFKIGEFSRFMRVSVKTLRHYDELGLLRPRVVDRFTNYRYYSADQVPRLNQILALRELGFSLEQIGRLLEAELSPEQMRGMFLGKRTEILARLREEEEQLRRVNGYLAQLENRTAARYDVVVRQIEPGLVASVRASTATTHTVDKGDEAGDSDKLEGDEEGDNEDVIGAIFEELEQYVARFKVRASLPPAIICHDSDYRADGQELEIVIPLSCAIPATERIRVYELPGWETMACLIHRGGYEELSQTFGALMQWIEVNNFTIAGPMRELYLRFGANQEGYELPESYVTAQVDELVTELQAPVMKQL